MPSKGISFSSNSAALVLRRIFLFCKRVNVKQNRTAEHYPNQQIFRKNYLDIASPSVGGVLSEFQLLLLQASPLLVGHLDEDEEHASHDASRHHDEDAGHVGETERGGR